MLKKILIALIALAFLMAAIFYYYTSATVCVKNNTKDQKLYIELSMRSHAIKSFKLKPGKSKKVRFIPEGDGTLSLKVVHSDGSLLSESNGYVAQYLSTEDSFTITPDMTITFDHGDAACK